MANELVQAVEEVHTPSSMARISQFMSIDGHLLQWATSKDMQALTSICKTGNSIAGLLLSHTVHLNKEKEERQLCVLLEKWKTPKDEETAAETVEIKNVIARTLRALYNRDKRLSGQHSRSSNEGAAASAREQPNGARDTKETRIKTPWQDNPNEWGWVDLWQLVIDPRGLEGFNRTCLHLFALTILIYENKVCIKEYGGTSSGNTSYAVRVVEDEVKGCALPSFSRGTSCSSVAPVSDEHRDNLGARIPFEGIRQAILSPWNYGLYQKLCCAMQLTPDVEPMVDTRALLAKCHLGQRRLQVETTQSNVPREIRGFLSVCSTQSGDQGTASARDKCGKKIARRRQLRSVASDTSDSPSDVPGSDLESGSCEKKRRRGF
ncbi:conserved hypothetical protein [Neospora caninum Liverpool]|uniref:Nse4 n=1 Tax=Neospora caninum (strain Liverpool) TaxID=572307 RepID=F0V926_NEOCL|nr:conserved hypothetical protein [Neospora caninum Liverpool]CBZ50217.1 conserved hypothetical protein [Neospora caninum Liverpool]|eukprot:XP_003880252.1 conserved hypothetical protein [Neospora caninum Liverpool]